VAGCRGKAASGLLCVTGLAHGDRIWHRSLTLRLYCGDRQNWRQPRLRCVRGQLESWLWLALVLAVAATVT
jgi:hypothetical protein